MNEIFRELPLVAILRGIKPTEAAAIGDALFEAGFRIIEVPLNSPDPLRSIELLATRLPACVVGAGTVLSADQVTRVQQAGGRLIVAPNFSAEVVAQAVALGLLAIPGVATPTEAFAALRAGAHALKLFPAEGVPPAVLAAWRSVLPAETAVLPVGGVTAATMATWRAAGANGFGFGSAVYRAGDDVAKVSRAAALLVRTWREWAPGT